MAPNVSRGLALAVGAVAGALGPGVAHADPTGPTPAQIQAARAVFVQAEADEDAGRWSEALAKLRQVLATKDTAGVRYHIALCEEHLGDLAQAQSDYAGAEAAAHAEQARDVLRLVGKKLAAIEARVPHVTIVIVPDAPGATVSLDARPVQPGSAVAVDPGTHVVDVTPADGRSPSRTPFSVAEGETTTVSVPPAGPGTPAPAPNPPVPPIGATTPAALPPATPARSHTAAWLETAGAALLAGAGAAAYVAAGAARDQAQRSCALVTEPSSGSCDPYRVPVRAWDWAAIGAWTGAGAMATWAVLSWARGARGGGGEVTVGASSVRIEGAF